MNRKKNTEILRKKELQTTFHNVNIYDGELYSIHKKYLSELPSFLVAFKIERLGHSSGKANNVHS